MIDQFEHRGTIEDAMKLFAERHFGEPRQIDRNSVRPDGILARLFRLKDGLRTYRIEGNRGVWIINLVEPTP